MSPLLSPIELYAGSLGYLDSNQGIEASKAPAVPLGYTPKKATRIVGNPKPYIYSAPELITLYREEIS